MTASGRYVRKCGTNRIKKIQLQVMADPKRHPVIRGTHGLGKMRYAPVSGTRGKSGALRVCYVHFERLATVVLVIVYSKNEMDDIPEGSKPAVNVAIDEIEVELNILHLER